MVRTGSSKASNYQQCPARGRKIIHDNYCVSCVAGKKNCVHVSSKSVNLEVDVAGQKDCLFVTNKRKTVNILPVNSCVVTHVHFAGGLSHKKGINHNIVHCEEIKCVNDVSCIDHLSCVHNVTNVPIVVSDWKKWAALAPSGSGQISQGHPPS